MKIGQLGRVVTGKTPPSAKPELFGKAHPFITPSDIDSVSRTVLTERFVSDEGVVAFKNQVIPAGAVCFVCIGATIGKMCVATCQSLTNQQINSVVVDKSLHDPRFVYYALRQIAPNVKGLAGGAATPIISKSSFSDIEIWVAPLDQQRRIAAILSVYDNLIENNTQRILILEEMARRIYEEWFVRFRFPGHERVRMVESELGLVPERWGRESLADCAMVTMGQSPSSEFYNQDGHGLPFHQGVTNFGRHFPTHKMFCSVDGRLAEDSDILVSVRAPVGRINLSPSRLVIGRGLCAIRSREGQQVFLLHRLLETFKDEDSMGNGAIFKAVSKQEVLGLRFLVPPSKLITQFEAIAGPLWKLIRNLTAKNENLRSTRDLLLPKLISGELDVSKLPEAKAAA